MSLRGLVSVEAGAGALHPAAIGAAGPRAASDRRPFAGVRIAENLHEAAAAWSRLDAVAHVSPYQRHAWMAAWAETEGRALGLTIAIVIALDAEGHPVALLPLGIERRGPVRAAIFLGGRQTNYNMGLFDPATSWTAADVTALLRAATRAMRPRPDMMVLTHQPLRWHGFDNPLAALPRSQPSPSFSHRAVLRRDGEAFLREHQSAAARKKLRAKAAHLAAIGPVTHRVARTPDEIDTMVRAHLVQKDAKLAAIGVTAPDKSRLHAMFVRAALPTAAGDPPPLELHALFCGDTIVATFGGLARAGRFSGTLISYAVEPCYARASPGELLLTAVLRQKCAEGFDSFDLGIGEARYKDTYCPIPDPLVDSFFPVTALGRAWSAAEALRLRLKSWVKRSPRAWSLARTLRKTIGSLTRRAGAA